MSFQGKYQILSPLGDGESQLFRALQVSSGRPVLLHHLAAGRTPSPQPDLASLIFKFLRTASAEESRHFLDMGEEEGRLYVVTADVPDCLDLRKWLESVADARAGKEGTAQPAAAGTPDLGSLAFTRTYTTEALRQVSRSPGSEGVPPSAEPLAASPPVPPPEKSPGVLIPPLEIPARSSEVTDGGPTDFSGFWEKSSPANQAGQPASIPAPPGSPESSDAPSGVPAVTEVYSSRRPALSIHDAPTAAMATLQAQAAERERALAQASGPAEAGGNAGNFADLMLTPPEVMKPPGVLSVGEVSIATPQPAEAPSAVDSETKIPQSLTGLLMETGKAPPQAAASASTAGADDKQGAEGKSEEKGPRRQIPMGFEVVFQSSKARSRPTWPGPQDQSGIMTAPEPSGLSAEAEESVPAPAAAGLPNFAPMAVSPPAEKIGGGPALSFPDSLGNPRKAVGTRNEPSVLPLPSVVKQALPESEKATRPVPTPPVLPAGIAPRAAADVPALPGRAASRVSAPMPPSPSRGQPGEYTRMIENVKAIAGPLPQVGSPGISPAPTRATYLHVPVPQSSPYHEAPPPFQPSPYIAKETPIASAGKKRKVWVPILILSSLLVMTVALLLFFAFKH